MRMGSGLSKLFAMIGSFFSFNKRGKVEMSASSGGRKTSTMTSRQARRMKAKGKAAHNRTRTRTKCGGPNWLKIAIRSQR